MGAFRYVHYGAVHVISYMTVIEAQRLLDGSQNEF